MNITPLGFKSSCRLATILFSIIALFGSASAGIFTVTKTADTNDGECSTGDCSLREAVTAANNTPQADRIYFYPPVSSPSQPIILTGGSLTIENNGAVEFDGRNLAVTISGGNASRIFVINPSATVTFRDLTLTNGRGEGQNLTLNGGAIHNGAGANTTLINVIVSNNQVFSSDGNSTLYGGGIYNAGTMYILRSRIENNSVPVSLTNTSGGGGIYNGFQATLKIEESSVTNNTVEGNGGGINNNSQATLNLINTTVSGNSATGALGIGGGIVNFATATAIHTTVANNSAAVAHGGVSNSDSLGTYTSRNSIYGDNTAGANNRDFRGTMISGGFNLIENTTDTIITGDTTGNILNQDPRLRPLVLSVYLTSRYQAPNSFSPAVDSGKVFEVRTDQRGNFNRPFDNPAKPNAPNSDGTDIGAVELTYSEIPNQAPFDFDGDRKTDVSIFRPSNSQWWFALSSTNSTGVTVFSAAFPFTLVPADYTGDGKVDLACYRAGDGEYSILRSENSTYYEVEIGTSGDVPVPADYDGDGKADPAIFRASFGVWVIKRSSNNVTTSQYFGTAGDKPAVADYDGDEKADIAIFRPSTGAWWINRSSLGVIAIQFGQSGDKVVQGDYTGDGKAELALWRESNGFWYILRSEDYSFYGFPFGTAGDAPTPGDYDGDGKLDAGVYRPSNNVWYLLRSTQGFSSQQFGTSGDVPIPAVFVR